MLTGCIVNGYEDAGVSLNIDTQFLNMIPVWRWSHHVMRYSVKLDGYKYNSQHYLSMVRLEPVVMWFYRNSIKIDKVKI